MENKKVTYSASIGQLNLLSEVVKKLFEYSPISIIFEFGSRYGEDTVELATKYPDAIIYAFECNEKSIPVLKDRIQGYSNVIFNNKAISDENGPISFFQIDEKKTRTTWDDGNQGASSLYKASGKYPLEEYYQNETLVEAITLHSFMSKMKIKSIDLMWIDVQGAELKALKGLEEKINDLKVVHLEVEFIEIYKGQPLFKEINRFFVMNGFKLLGFTSKSFFSGDAVYVNERHFTSKQIFEAKQILPELNKGLINLLREAKFRIKYLGFKVKRLFFS